MSVLPNQSQLNASAAFFAPAGSTGGGGGGSVGPNLTLSTLTLGVGQNANAVNLLLGTGILNLAQAGDSNGVQIGQAGFDMTMGNQYAVYGDFANGAQGDITFGDINGNNSAFVGINYLASGLVSGNVSTVIWGHTQIFDLQVSSINNATPGGGGSVPANLALSTLTMNGGVSMVNNTIKFSSDNQAVQYYNAGDSNFYITGLSTNSVAIGTQDSPQQLLINSSTVTCSDITLTKIYPLSNQVYITQDAGPDFLVSFSGTGLGLGLIAQNATDGLGITASNGGVVIQGGGNNFAIEGVSTINGSAPALTSGVQSDVASLFSSLFAANPGLSTIVY